MAREILLKPESIPAEVEMLARLADSAGQPWRVGQTVGGDEPVRSLVSQGNGFPGSDEPTADRDEVGCRPTRIAGSATPGVPLAVSQDGRLVLVRTYEGPEGEPAEVVLIDRASGNLKR